jgi:hypothetical protein
VRIRLDIWQSLSSSDGIYEKFIKFHWALVVLINTGFWWALYGFKEDNFAAIEKICN